MISQERAESIASLKADVVVGARPFLADLKYQAEKEEQHVIYALGQPRIVVQRIGDIRCLRIIEDGPAPFG